MNFQTLIQCFQDSKTALYWAVEKGHLAIVKTLLDYNASKEIPNKVGDFATFKSSLNFFPTPFVCLFQPKQIEEMNFLLVRRLGVAITLSACACVVRFSWKTTPTNSHSTILGPPRHFKRFFSFDSNKPSMVFVRDRMGTHL